MEGSPTASPAEARNPRLFTPAFIALLLAEFAYFTAAGMEIPLAPLFAARMLGADEVGVGIAVGALALTVLFLRPFAGRSSDRSNSHGQLDRAVFAAGSVTRSTLQPGWRWPEHVGRAKGLGLCPVPRLGYVVAGRTVVVMARRDRAPIRGRRRDRRGPAARRLRRGR